MSEMSDVAQVAQVETVVQNPDQGRLENSPEWRNLTDKQKRWIVQFRACGSALTATKAAYDTKSEANARVLSYEISKNPKILSALDVAAGKVRTEREILIETVKAHLKATEKGSIAASKFAAQLERLQLGGKPEVEDDPKDAAETSSNPRFKVGDICVQSGQKFRVTAINEDGQPIAADEVE